MGFQALERHFQAIGDEAFVPSTDIKEYGIFTLQRLDKGDWGLDAGLRFDSRELKTDLTKRSFDNVSGSLGLFYKPADKQFVALTLSRNGRAPTEFELFADGPHPGTGGYEVGDATLKSEKVTSLEATYRYTGERLRLEGHPDQPEWLSHVNASVLKVKLGTAIIGISSIHLLKTFINAANYDEKVLLWQTVIHIAFLLSAMAIAMADRLMSHATQSEH